jgi:hypothetical protein
MRNYRHVFEMLPSLVLNQEAHLCDPLRRSARAASQELSREAFEEHERSFRASHLRDAFGLAPRCQQVWCLALL